MNHAAGILVLTLIMLAPISAQRFDLGNAGELRKFETNWLTAQLNDDRGWLSRFSIGKLDVLPSPGVTFGSREDAVSALTETPLQANEMKVRISGTISRLTNDPNLNRSLFFLDTFNKVGGKWRVIASNISPIPAAVSPQAKDELLKLENDLAQAVVTNNPLTIDRLIAPEFVSTSIDGQIENRERWLEARRSQNAKDVTLTEMQVHSAADNFAVVTGIDTSVRSDGGGKEITYADRFTHTWSKRGGLWRCVAAHATRIQQ